MRRLLSILMLLQLRVRLTSEELAREFGVSVRTIYRDVEELGAAGIPVYADRGPGGGFQLVDGYRTRLTGLGTDEAEAVFMIGLPGAAAAMGLGPAATNAGRKLLAALPQVLSDGAGRLGQRFHLDPVDWYREEELAEHLPTIARAVLDQRVVRMTYESWTGVRPWVIEPLGLVLKAGAWYVVGQRDGVPRIFRVSKVVALTMDDATFVRPARFDLAAYWAGELVRFEAALRPGTATLRIAPAGLDRLSRLGGYATRAIRDAGPADTNQWTTVRLPFETIEQAAFAILGLGPDAIVVEPEALRVRVRELARAVVARSDDQPETT